MQWTEKMLHDTIERGDSELAWVIRERACSYLAGRCDFATTRDRMGFNARDAVPGHSFADQIAKSTRPTGYKLSFKQQAWAAQFLVKYVVTQLLPVVEELTSLTQAATSEPQPEPQPKAVVAVEPGITCPKCGGQCASDGFTCPTCAGVGRINTTKPTEASVPEPIESPAPSPTTTEEAWAQLSAGPSPAEKRRVEGALRKHNRLSKRTVHGGAILMG